LDRLDCDRSFLSSDRYSHIRRAAPQNRADMPDADPSRWVHPRDLARVIAFLASDAARAIHGAGVPVTGLS
jgi:NAD(P)-dependent dehydrogenase (short-subunit alcohol dehydrogenase family)